jgi:parvulin-like peptidyl-prolyl isomerase
MNSMRYISLVAVAASLALPGSARADSLDGIVEIVNDAPITFLQVQDLIEEQVNSVLKYYPPAQQMAEVHKLQANALDGLVQNKLILNDFIRQGYMTNVLEKAVDQEILRIIKNSPAAGDRSVFVKTLQEQGRTLESFRKQEWESFIVHYASWPYLHPEEAHKIIISPLKIQAYYNDHKDEFKVDDQVKLRRIAIRQEADNAPGFARQMAEEVLQKIDSGTPFAEMAAVYNSGSDRANGGDRGWVFRKDSIQALSDAAFALKPGQHSQVVEVKDEQTGTLSCYLEMVEDVKPAHNLALSEVQAGIERTLVDQKGRELLEQWLARLRAKSHLTTFSAR